MFQFFKRKPSKVDACAAGPVEARAPSQRNDTRKDVVNLLIPSTDYNQKTGVSAILQIMAGKKRKGRKKTRAESCRVSPPKTSLVRSASVRSDAANENSTDACDHAEFVKALVLQKYAKTPTKEHVSRIYVNKPNIDEKKHAQALLRELAKKIDCPIEDLSDTNDINQPMGGTDSKNVRDNKINDYKNDLNKELNRLKEVAEENNESTRFRTEVVEQNKESNRIKEEVVEQKRDDRELNRLTEVVEVNRGIEEERDDLDNPIVKKSNLKVPKSDNEGCSDDDRSDSGKKKVTFRKHIIFDDGEQQTDEEIDSSFESLTSEEEDYLEDALDNKTVIEVNNEGITIKIENAEVGEEKRTFNNSDNSVTDSGFVEISDNDKNEVKSDSESETEEEIVEEIIEEEISIAEFDEEEVEEEVEEEEELKSIVSQETRFQAQVAAITELAESRSEQAERARDLLASYRKEIDAKEGEIEQLKCELAAAYKESELVRQRSRSLEEELAAARSCSAGLADQLHRRNEECVRELRAELDQALARQGELESRVLVLERDRDRLEQEKAASEQKALEAIATAEENTSKWRLAHEAARSQAAARAERILADCEWKMREIEKRARDAEKENRQLKESVDQLKSNPPIPSSHLTELSQLRGLASEQQRSVQCLTLQLQKVETREEALKLEVHRLKELLDREVQRGKEKEDMHLKKITTLQSNHASAIESLKAEHASTSASTRAALERANAERTRAALAQLREEMDMQARNADRKLREVQTRYDNLKEELSTKQREYEAAIAEARSKADWDILQLRHLLDKADIEYANNVENLSRKYEEQKESLLEEWSDKLKEVEEQAASEVDEAKRLLEATRMKLVAERVEQINKLKDQHRREMDDQWEQFMTDKENCLARMKMECRQEGDEERIKREKELLEEISELKSQVYSKSSDFDNLAVKAAACGRTLAVTEQELREALAREKELREKRSEDLTKLKQAEKASKEQIEHLTRKCACLRKLFDDIRARLMAREKTAEQEARARDKELHQLRGEVARLTKILVEQSSPKLGARTRADGCEMQAELETRRKGYRTPDMVRKRTCPLPELPTYQNGGQNGRRRANSVDLPAVQVPARIKQLEGKKD